MTSDKKTRRRYSAAQKAQVLAECDEPGASVANVAMAHGINANIVHRWRQLSRDEAPAGPANASGFLALSLPAPEVPTAVAADVRVEVSVRTSPSLRRRA
ncbi:MAG TPA: transposase [Roseateles sp.]|nr:transposase [Roseateles sp.]